MQPRRKGVVVNHQPDRRVAIVTGGAGGIGRAICAALAADGLHVAVVDRDIERANAVAATLDGEGHIGYAADVSDEASVTSLFREVRIASGPVSVLVTAAGILLLRPDGSRKRIAETPLDDWERTQAVNSRGVFLCCREYAREVPDAAVHPRIVTISSVAAQLGGFRSSAAYIASKAAVLGFTKALARELAEKNVSVNSVAPGVIDAPMLRLSLDPANDDSVAASIPLGRIGQPEDVAQAVRFLVSPGSGYLTGTVIDVNGGYRMQ
jgi:3-oxoacyl-[acyl-carrier protein] reductase